jgi:hypothetical protein
LRYRASRCLSTMSLAQKANVCRAAALIRSCLEFGRNVGEQLEQVKFSILFFCFHHVMAGLVPAIHV